MKRRWIQAFLTVVAVSAFGVSVHHAVESVPPEPTYVQKPDLDLLPAQTFPVSEPDGSSRKPAPPARSLADVLRYVGAFRMPDGNLGESTFDYGGTALAFNPANKSLFIVGHDWHQAIAEVKIPNSIVNSAKVEDLATAKVLQPFAKILPRVPNLSIKEHPKIGGLLVVDGKLIGSAYEYYDGPGKVVDSHFRLDSLNLSSAKVEGLFQVGDMGGGFVGGYMAPVPPEWQQALGTRYVTGQAALCIISRTSSGPAAFGFDPSELRDMTPATPLVCYPLKHALGPMVGKDRFFNGATQINGVFFVPGSRTVLFFGSHGIDEIGYGEAPAFNDPFRASKGYHSRDGRYQYQIWAYDVLDFVAVKEGKKQPWQIKPYAVWPLSFPFDDGAKRIGGVAFDPEGGRLYVSQVGGDHGKYRYFPLIHVYRLAVSTR